MQPPEAAMSPEALCAGFQADVRDVVEARRAGGGLGRAISEAARLFGLSERRVRACWHGEVRSVSAAEWHAVERTRQAMLVAREQELAAELEVIKRRLAALRACS